MAENLEAAEPANILNDERARRLADRAALYAAGKNPYPERSSVTDHAADLLDRYEHLANEEVAPETVTIGGRVVAKRGQGKIMFIVVRDPSADIQLFCRVNDVEEESWEVLKELDLGDIVQATGQMTRTKRGELSIAPRTAQLLSKAVRPLPEKFHGLSDKETRYRQRYVDLIVNEDVRETFRKRSAIVSAFRRYMEDNGYMEVETPILQSIQGGATAKPFITHFNALNQENYLRIATELHLKRLLVGGYERVFEIGRIFRNEGMDLTHNPEFTTMEAYRAYSDLEGMKELAEGVIKAAARAIGLEGMIDYQGQAIDLFSPWPSRPMTDVVSEVLGRTITIDTPVEELRAACDEHDIEYKPEWTAGKLIAELFDELGEAILINPTFVVDYPVEVSPLAKRHEDDPRLTHRFELFIAAHEYANAFSELNDPVDQAERFAAQMEEKAGGDDEAMEYDEDYVRALEYGMPPAGGIGIGIDGYGFIVIVVADDLENGHADLSDTLLVNLVEGHVVPDQVAQRNAVNGGLQFLLHVRDQQGQHLLVEHRHLVVAADLHVGQRQQGETLFFARAFELEAALHDVVVAHGDLLVDLRHAVLHRNFVFGGDGDEYERGVPLHAHLVDALGVGGRHRDAVAHDHALDRAGTVGDTAHEVHAGLGGDVHLFVEAAENLGAFVLAASHEAGGQQEDQQIFDVFYHFFGFLKFISCPGAPDRRDPPGSPGISNRGSARSGCWPRSPSWGSGTGFCSCR